MTQVLEPAASTIPAVTLPPLPKGGRGARIGTCDLCGRSVCRHDGRHNRHVGGGQWQLTHSVCETEFQNRREAYQLVGDAQGWGIFDMGEGRYKVERLDEGAILESDDEAIDLARAAGLVLDDEGILARTMLPELTPELRALIEDDDKPELSLCLVIRPHASLTDREMDTLSTVVGSAFPVLDATWQGNHWTATTADEYRALDLLAELQLIQSANRGVPVSCELQSLTIDDDRR